MQLNEALMGENLGRMHDVDISDHLRHVKGLLGRLTKTYLYKNLEAKIIKQRIYYISTKEIAWSV